MISKGLFWNLVRRFNLCVSYFALQALMANERSFVTVSLHEDFPHVKDVQQSIDVAKVMINFSSSVRKRSAGKSIITTTTGKK